jgi:transposase
LTRGREDMKHLQRQAKQRLLAMLLRYGHRFDGQSNWTQAHFRWLEGVKFAHPAQQIMFQEYIDAIVFMGRRVETADLHIEQAAQSGSTWPVIQALMALRGVNLLTAATIVAEIGDLRRFDSASKLMAYLGLVPSEHSSANSVRRGGITKTGNSHVRRVLTEAAWTYRFAARKTAVIQRRAERTPEAVQEIAWKAQQRLCQRYQQLNGKSKLKVQVCTAIARELSGFIWAIGQSMPALKPTVNK